MVECTTQTKRRKYFRNRLCFRQLSEVGGLLVRRRSKYTACLHRSSLPSSHPSSHYIQPLYTHVTPSPSLPPSYSSSQVHTCPIKLLCRFCVHIDRDTVTYFGMQEQWGCGTRQVQTRRTQCMHPSHTASPLPLLACAQEQHHSPQED